ncbi:MAG: MepB family protein [Bacteriovorax sp.]|nr:MepB family protein [Bacteriovorax sp.]
MKNLKSWNSLPSIHSDLLKAKELVYDKCAYECSLPIREAESAEYAAFDFEINGLSIKFRAARITPTKIGQFVTLWKRESGGPIRPFDDLDLIDLFIISVRKDNFFGQFIFPKAILCHQGIVTTRNKEGKRAMRVYPSWDITVSKQAQKTQKWQLDYFLEIPEGEQIDLERAKRLYLDFK